MIESVIQFMKLSICIKKSMSFCNATEIVYNNKPVLYSKNTFDVGLDDAIFWLGNVVSFMSVVVCVTSKKYIEI